VRKIGRTFSGSIPFSRANFFSTDNQPLTLRPVVSLRFKTESSPTHDWRRIKTLEDAAQIAKDARTAKNPNAVAHGKRSWAKRQQKQKAGTENSLVSVQGDRIEGPDAPVRKTRTTESGEKTVLFSIARVRERNDRRSSLLASHLK
jgi:hypothetical protein